MAFDQNQWYQVTVKSGKGVSMYGSSLFDHGLGTVYFQTTNTTLFTERWQIFPFNSSTHVIRSQDSGPHGYLATAYSVNETTPGQTRPQMSNYTLADNSMLWQVTPWGDGTFYLTNLANGTAWHLQVKPNTLMAMSSDFTGPPDGGSFSFNPLGQINDQAFSTINPPSATSTTSSTGSISTSNPTSTSTQSTTPTGSTGSTGSSGLSAGASTAIAVSIGVVVLLLGLAGFFFWRRQRKRRQFASKNRENIGNQAPMEPMEPMEPTIEWPKEHQQLLPNAEMTASMPPVELPGQIRFELPGETTGNER